MITATFDRIGRTHNVPPLTIDSDDPDEIAEKIYHYARPRLASRQVDVYLDLDKMSGGITCGFNSGGRFTLTADPPVDAPAGCNDRCEACGRILDCCRNCPAGHEQ